MRTIIIYHADCLDGFGAAYAAWKKFGDEAEYIPCRHGDPAPQNLAGARIYMIDFSYPKEVLLAIEAQSAGLTILDHHIGALDAVKSTKDYLFDNDRSGASIAWSYFHTDSAVPRLISYVEDGDLWRNALPNTIEVGAYLSTLPFTFEAWEKAAQDFAQDASFAQIIAKGAAYREYREHALAIMMRDAEEVEFEGYRVFALNVPRLFRSEIGNLLAEKKPPFAIIWYHYQGQMRCSLRGTGEVNLAEIAGRYGGNGHHNASSFRIPEGKPLPWKRV